MYNLNNLNYQTMNHNPSYGLLPPTSPSLDWRGYPTSSAAGDSVVVKGPDDGNPGSGKVVSGGQSHQISRQISLPYSEIPTPRLGWNASVVNPGQQRAISVNPNQQRQEAANAGKPSSANFPHKSSRHSHSKYDHHTSQKQKSDIPNDIPEIDWADVQVIESLGNGEFGQVFKGTWRGQNVAIKALYRDPNKSHDSVAIAELRKEIDSFRHLNHKRLVRFIGACFQHPHLCFITEYMPNGSLYNFLHVRKVRLPTKHSLNMTMQLTDGVDYLHSRNPIVVHRDLKSLNVVLDLRFNIKLCDFGLTEYIDKNSTRARHNGGSPRYMAPELFDKKLKITEKIDVWAMSCIFCEIFGGTIPYDGVKDMSTLTHIILSKRQSPNVPNMEIEAVKVLIKDCFSFDQEVRPSSREVAKRLDKIKKNYTPAQR